MWDTFQRMASDIQAVVLEKENKAFELRVRGGLTFESIAQQLGYSSRGSAQKAYLRALERLKHEDIDRIAQEDLERLDVLTETYWQAAVQGNLRAADMVLAIMDKRLKYLERNKPIKIQAEVVNYDGNRSLDAEVIQLARVIEYIEGVTPDITTLPNRQDKGEPDSLATPSAEGTITAAG